MARRAGQTALQAHSRKDSQVRNRENQTGRNKMKNWKTTLAGIGAGALQLFANGTNWKSVLLAASMAVLGTFAKDSNVTGGTTPQ
jgi:hypothetical protein